MLFVRDCTIYNIVPIVFTSGTLGVMLFVWPTKRYGVRYRVKVGGYWELRENICIYFLSYIIVTVAQGRSD